MNSQSWHSLKTEEILKKLETSRRGLDAKIVQKNLKKYGKNELPKEKQLSTAVIFLNQFKSPLVYVLLSAALLTLFLNDYIDTGIIMLAVALNAIFGFYQEYKANKAVTFLRSLVQQKVRVIRSANETQIDSADVVPGDIVVLEAGDKITADARLISADSFQVNESALTGESVPSDKNVISVSTGANLADRENMVYSGTVVTKGRASAVVTATGLNTELGKITTLVKNTKEEDTPLQVQLAKFSKMLSLAVLLICIGIVIIGVIYGRELLGFGHEAREGMINTAIAIAVAAIPEGLLISVTAILALGMQSILRKKALVRKLIAAETLGSVSVICTDKTGTLTEGKMKVSRIITSGDELTADAKLKYQDTKTLKDHDLLQKISVLCNNAAIENPKDDLAEAKFLGDPTEVGLLSSAISASIPYEQLQKIQPRIMEIPFDSELKYMATLNALNNSTNVLYIKGAPEIIIEMCARLRSNGKKINLTPEAKRDLKRKYEKLTGQGLRVLGFAYKQVSNTKKINKLYDELNELIFAGFIALKDPLRPHTKETLELAANAGIKTVIITGDHKLTAKSIVAELGIKTEAKNILEGKDLEKLSDDELDKILPDVKIYARVEPKHKLRIISHWQKRGEVVAMTGDGVNDAPALKAADIGIALGSGTDVAKETSDMILLDNNFKTIVSAIERGRVIFDNIRKVILYLLVGSFSEIILITGAIILALPLPLLPAQIIWINLVTDGFPNLALTFEKGEKDIMKDRPRPKNEKILNREMKTLIFIIGVITDIILLGLFFGMLGEYEINHLRTIIFAALGVDSLLYVFSCRSLRHSIFTQNPFSNKLLVVAVGVGFLLQLTAIYVPFFQNIFDNVPLGVNEWLIVGILAVVKITAIELTKNFFIVNRRNAQPLPA